MLGNFSFGQYFKEGAIEFATEFVQERMQLDWDRIWVTVHAGDPQLKLGPDKVAIELWKPSRRCRPSASCRCRPSENFWSVGGPGPCGPDSEIYWDWGEEHGCGEPDCAPACPRCDRFLEFWNLVFMAYEQHPDGTLTPLPTQNIDTGLGLERGAAILQDVRSVYETDGYQRIMEWIEAESGVAYGDSAVSTKAHRILADHGRGMTFLVADGVTPSNESRGYVLRRIIRRAVIQAQRIGLAALYPLTGGRRRADGHAYPELRERADEIAQVVRTEEERFEETLDRGMKLFEELAAKGPISGEDAFTLAATYGFPLELTVELAEERGRRSTSTATTPRWSGTARSRAPGSRATSSAPRSSRAKPASRRSSSATRRRTCSRRSARSSSSTTDASSRSSASRRSTRPAAARSAITGGSSATTSRGRAPSSSRRTGSATTRRCSSAATGFSAGDRVRAVVPWSVRFPTMANHTATHLLHQALRDDARRARPPGGLGRAPGQAPLRLHARARARRPRSASGSSGS